MRWDPSGECLQKSYQAIRPAYICRQYKDPIAYPAGSCPSTLAFAQQPYNTKDTNQEALSSTPEFADASRPAQIKCIGPDLVIGSFSTQDQRLANFQGLPVFTEYVPVNYTAWKPVREFNFDNLKRASVVMFSFFYKTSWVQFVDLTTQSTHFAVAFIFIFIIIVVSYYLLNLTVGIMCLNFSEAVKAESILLESSGGDDDVPEDDEEEDEEEEDDDDEEGDTEAESLRSALLSALGSGPCCGNALFPLPYLVDAFCFVLENLATIIITKVPIIKLLGKSEGFKNAGVCVCVCVCACACVCVCVRARARARKLTLQRGSTLEARGSTREAYEGL